MMAHGVRGQCLGRWAQSRTGSDVPHPCPAMGQGNLGDFSDNDPIRGRCRGDTIEHEALAMCLESCSWYLLSLLNSWGC